MRKPRAPKKRIAGTYPIDTGEASIVADPARDGGYVLEVNRVPSSYVVPGAPEVLEYDYMRWIAGFAESHTLRPECAVHLGAAGCALPSYFAHRFGGEQVAVEVDAELAELVRWAFDPPVVIQVAEARAFIDSLIDAPSNASTPVHAITRDVFAGPDTPRALTTVEFFRAVRSVLTPGGLYVANVGDRAGLEETRAELAGLREVFAHIAVAGPEEMLAGRAYGNLVIAASDALLAFNGEVPWRGSDRDGAWMADRIAGAAPRHD